MSGPRLLSADAAFGSRPAAVMHLAATLARDGHVTYLVGGCVRDLLQGRDASDFDLATSATPERILELFPRAVPIGLQHGTVMVPTAAGPVDVTRFRAGRDIESDLAHRDFTINALAVDLASGELIDPFGGVADLEAARLRAVGEAAARFREDPLRVLRAARLVATLDLEVDPGIERALGAARAGLRTVARERVRAELARLFVGPSAARGLTLLERAKISQDLFGDLAPDAIAMVAALPADLELRLAGWLRGAKSERILGGLRFPRRVAERVARLLRSHPIGKGLDLKRDAALRKLIKQAGEENLEKLFALRTAEIELLELHDGVAAAAERARLEALVAALSRVRQAGDLALRRFDLAIDGADVMRVLGCAPGRTVGRALRHLTDAVIEDPSVNDVDSLRRLLRSWADRELDATTAPNEPNRTRRRGSANTRR